MQSRVTAHRLISECIEQGLKLHDLEREFIVVALEKSKDRRVVAAKQVGICLQTLYKKIHKFQIRRFHSFPEFQKDLSLTSAQKLGQMIRQARRKKEMEPKELAHFLGYKSSSSICHIEHGRKVIPEKLIPRVSSLLGIPISDLNQLISQIKTEKESAG